jgi:putative pyrroloquinoline-quinone binding quinoprotein
VRQIVPAAAAVLVVVAAFAMVALRPDSDQRRWHIEQFATVPGNLSAGTAGFGSFWTYDVRSSQILRVDFGTRRVIARIPLATDLPDVALATTAGAVWALPVKPSTHTPAPSHPAAGLLMRIDPRHNRIADRIRLRAPNGLTVVPVGIIARRNEIWVWGEAGAQRIAPGGHRVSVGVTVPGDTVMAFTATDTRVSVLTQFGRLVTFDSRTGNRLGNVAVAPPLYNERLISIGGAIVIDNEDGSIASIDPIDGRTRWSARLGREPTTRCWPAAASGSC